MKQTTFNYKPRFAPLVESQKKRTTVRMFIKSKPPKKGDALQHFTGMRTRKCRQLLISICRDVQPIKITERGIWLGRRRLSPTEEWWLATGDGFSNQDEFRAFFRDTYGFPLPGKPHWVAWS
ncbi:MAG: hypothetical protein HOP33_19145 [Verrucomicrobia bacterium]|nr:hypothetical protein [Verrucomicrobiota bacterium]